MTKAKDTLIVLMEKLAVTKAYAEKVSEFLPSYTMNKLTVMEAKHDAFQSEVDLMVERKVGDTKAAMNKIAARKEDICEVNKKNMQQVTDAEEEAGVGEVAAAEEAPPK